MLLNPSTNTDWRLMKLPVYPALSLSLFKAVCPSAAGVPSLCTKCPECSDLRCV